ncbi:MAG: amine oxidase [Sulfuricurvum sp. PC08-66]|nr:MAG: amine oxidase [Sulfuricurvum sp. PC08-66]
MRTNSYHTIIVGGGIAGLTAAAYLTKAGKSVLLIEKNEVCGGLVNTFWHNGFGFDAGVRALEDAGIIAPMLSQLGITLEMVPSPVSIGLQGDVVNIDTVHDIAHYRDMLIKHYPQNAHEIDALMKVIRAIMKDMEVLYGIENPLFKDLKKDLGYIFKKLLPWLPKFILTIGRINRMNRPVEEFLDTLLSNSALRDIIAQHFFKKTPTFFALSYMSLFLDYHYPKGGVGKLPEAITQKILAWGGHIRTQTTIREVWAHSQTLIDTHGASYTYENLIWAADLKTLYRITHTDHLPASTVQKIEKQKEAVMRSRGSDSIFSLFLEVDLPVEYFGAIAHGHFFYTPSPQGLGQTYTRELETLLLAWESTPQEELWAWLERYIELNTFEIAIPALKDPILAPQGQTGLVVSLLAEYELFVKVEQSNLQTLFKERLESKIIEVLTRSIFPKLKAHILHQFSFSPLGIAQRVASSEGAVTGWSFEYPSPVVNKIQFSDRSVLTPIPRVFQAGQWAYSPAGVPMSILTGKLASDRVLKHA